MTNIPQISFPESQIFWMTVFFGVNLFFNYKVLFRTIRKIVAKRSGEIHSISKEIDSLSAKKNQLEQKILNIKDGYFVLLQNKKERAIDKINKTFRETIQGIRGIMDSYDQKGSQKFEIVSKNLSARLNTQKILRIIKGDS